jgi:hypothetical protein
MWNYQSDPGRTSFTHGHGAPRASEASEMRERVSRAAESATDYASQMKDRVAETAGSYADSVADFADDARRRMAQSSARLTHQAQSTLQSTMQRILRKQPLAVAAAGLAAGAAIAAAFPSTEIEEHTFGSAGEALREAAGKAGETVKEAAGKAGERLKEAAEERGLTSQGLKELAGDVAGTFTSAVSGKSDDHGGATVVPETPATATDPGQDYGTGQGRGAPGRISGFVRTDIEPGRGGR